MLGYAGRRYCQLPSPKPSWGAFRSVGTVMVLLILAQGGSGTARIASVSPCIASARPHGLAELTPV